MFLVHLMTSCAHAHIEGFFASFYLGGFYLKGKHHYKRENLKPGEKKKAVEGKVKGPLDFLNRRVSDTEGTLRAGPVDVDGVITRFFNSVFPVNASPVFTPQSERFFRENKPSNIGNIPDGQTVNTYRGVLDRAIGRPGAGGNLGTGIFPAIETERQSDRQRLVGGVFNEAKRKLDGAASRNLGNKNFIDNLISPQALQGALRDTNIARALVNQRPQDIQNSGIPQPLKTELGDIFRDLGVDLNRAEQSIQDEFFSRVADGFEEAADRILRSPLITAANAQQVNYIPTEMNTPIFNPTENTVNKDAEKGRWETFEGTERVNKVGPVFGVGLGYVKNIGGHAFAGGEVYVMKPAMTVRYGLAVDKRPGERFGEMKMKPGVTLGVSAIAGKALNTFFGLYTRAGIEFTKLKFSYDVNNDDLPFPQASESKENFNATFKPVFAGVGGMFFMGTYTLSLEYNLQSFSKKTLRDFQRVGADRKRRGYISSGTGHRLTVRLMRLFGGKH